MAAALCSLIEACWNWQHYPQIFKHARTVVLHKPGKETYTQAGSWQPIALLNTLGKVIEGVTACWMQNLAEEHNLLPHSQMGAH